MVYPSYNLHGIAALTAPSYLQVADKIGTFVKDKGKPKSLLAKLTSPEHDFAKDEACSQALAELKTLFELLEMMGALEYLSFDLSLARGLDYYTGVIYEAVLEGANVGSIAAGGRYKTSHY